MAGRKPKTEDGAKRVGDGWRSEDRRYRVLQVETWIGEGKQHNEIRRLLMAEYGIEKRQSEYDIATAYKRLREEAEEAPAVRAARLRRMVLRRVERLEGKADRMERNAESGAPYEVAANKMIDTLARIDGVYAAANLVITTQETVGVSADAETLIKALDEKGRRYFAECWRQWEATGLIGPQTSATEAEQDDDIDVPPMLEAGEDEPPDSAPVN